MSTKRRLASFLRALVLTCLCLSATTVFAQSARSRVLHGFAEPVQTTSVAAAETGTLAELLVRPGDRVEKGRAMARLDQGVLRASLDAAVAKARSTARADAARVQLELAEARFKNLESLGRGEGVTAVELEKARAQAALARIEVTAAAEERKQRELEVKLIEAQIERRTIRSPISGIVTKVHREVGESISNVEPEIVTIVRLDQLRASFYVAADVARRMRSGGLVAVRFAESDRVSDARVEYVSPVTHAESGTVQVDVVIDNRNGAFRSGSRCMLEMPTQSAQRIYFGRRRS